MTQRLSAGEVPGPPTVPFLAVARLCARVVLGWLDNATGAFLLAAVGLVVAIRGRLAYEQKGP